MSLTRPHARVRCRGDDPQSGAMATDCLYPMTMASGTPTQMEQGGRKALHCERMVGQSSAIVAAAARRWPKHLGASQSDADLPEILSNSLTGPSGFESLSFPQFRVAVLSTDRLSDYSYFVTACS